MLTRAGRVVAMLFLLWLLGLVLAGLGILPARDIPGGRELVNQAPSPLPSLPKPPPQTGSDLASAQSLGARSLETSTQRAVGQPPGTGARAGSAAQAGRRSPAGVSRGASRGILGGAPRHTPATSQRGGGASSGAVPTSIPIISAPPPAPVTSNSSAGHGKLTAPGQTRQRATPEHVQWAVAGNSGSAPGQVTKTTTSTRPATRTTTPLGNSGSAPGQTAAHGNGHGNGG